ncbi:hypothetical protein B9W14_16020 [Clostridium drakei]|uniref:HNH endonuclease n=1 Tax=Clostridium drakei TaxID=332101 RepID=A0A2U8DT38_9CLOT|nr:hypothetical protein B9W14_16020 [Clostridium drakei]
MSFLKDMKMSFNVLFYVLQCKYMLKYRGEVIKVLSKIGPIPLTEYIDCLNAKNFNRDMAVKYTKKIYDKDISDVAKLHIFLVNSNVYREFEKQNPISKTAIQALKTYNPREYFSHYTCRRFYKFFAFIDVGEFDQLTFLMTAEHIHHIYPLTYGGTNKLENLIYVSEFNHKLLHKNPLENIEKYDFQAIDYLWYLYSKKLPELISKYNLKLTFDKSSSFIKNQFKNCIEEEMKIFYDYIVALENNKQQKYY